MNFFRGLFGLYPKSKLREKNKGDKRIIVILKDDCPYNDAMKHFNGLPGSDFHHMSILMGFDEAAQLRDPYSPPTCDGCGTELSGSEKRLCLYCKESER